MAYTVEHLNAIESAIAKGQLKVAFQGREVVYRSIDDLIKSHAVIKASLQEASVVTKRARYSYVARRMD